jgi:hypothetical protein
LLDEVFTLYSSQQCRSRFWCVATTLFDRMRDGAHDNSIDVSVLSALHDCCDHPSWRSVMAGVCEVRQWGLWGLATAVRCSTIPLFGDDELHLSYHLQASTKKNSRMLFPEFVRLMQQVCTNIDSCIVQSTHMLDPAQDAGELKSSHAHLLNSSGKLPNVRSKIRLSITSE